MARDDLDETLKRIQQAFEVQRRALQAIEEAILKGFSLESSNGQRLLSVQEASEQLGMGRSWVYQQIKSGELPSVQLGSIIKIKSKDLEEYIENRRG
jgi:excisionase family DNA binding protein